MNFLFDNLLISQFIGINIDIFLDIFLDILPIRLHGDKHNLLGVYASVWIC